MGLDMYAYVGQPGQHRDHWGQGEWSSSTGAFESPVEKPRELAYWRKHPNLHGWMRQLWVEKGHEGDFNSDELELTWSDIDQLEQDLHRVRLPHTQGFFFGDDADDYYREQDLEFCRNAKAELFLGLRVFYNSSW